MSILMYFVIICIVVFFFVNISKYRYRNKVKHTFCTLEKQHDQGIEECSLKN